ncbi:biotin carboxylase N-terminal domain-containing protein [Hyphococcus formosus]|uniref:acetyl/propionyl/methylcrotonyl-CoA carboxylase subunit alpha n=1 Tax=Hyphococcus formosus TaxID=3143534 RepID=UPI00398B9E96
MKTIRRLLVANRGEIACRIIRTAKVHGIETIAVYSAADEGALHIRQADQAEFIGPAEPAKSYLNIDVIIAAAKRSNADAIHPGYGFLSERADFAAACKSENIIFVGPPADAISAMGDKASAKERMIAAGVPCIPGFQGADQSIERLTNEAENIGYPVIVKASAGGGGRGMRIVEDPNNLSSALKSAKAEAESAFGDGNLLLERAVIGARHIEIQIFADEHGNCIYLGERDCSLQRRNQKVIEEAPSPVLSDDQRIAMGEAAVKAAKVVGYVGAGTVEFLYDVTRQEFYFLEMNTRLQVEHPVTEMVTGLDLVEIQLDVAAGNPLPITQADIEISGWSMEARLYAEDPANGFVPHSGTVSRFEPAPGVRCDTGIETGDVVPSHYDPMVAKVIAHGRTRDEARRKLVQGLNSTVLFGVVNNRGFLVSLLESKEFASGDAATDFIEKNIESLGTRQSHPLAVALAAAAMIDVPFESELTGWNSRGIAEFPLMLDVGNDGLIRATVSLNGRDLTVRVNDEVSEIRVERKTEQEIQFSSNGTKQRAIICRRDDAIDVQIDGISHEYKDVTLAPASDTAGGDSIIKAPMAGLVTSVSVSAGDKVSKGQTVATIEAMKMEHQLKVPRDGVVSDVIAKIGDQVAIRSKLVILEAENQ